jgi:hypothetical protein
MERGAAREQPGNLFRWKVGLDLGSSHRLACPAAPAPVQLRRLSLDLSGQGSLTGSAFFVWL